MLLTETLLLLQILPQMIYIFYVRFLGVGRYWSFLAYKLADIDFISLKNTSSSYYSKIFPKMEVIILDDCLLIAACQLLCENEHHKRASFL